MGEQSILTVLVLLSQQDKSCTFQGSRGGIKEVLSLMFSHEN